MRAVFLKSVDLMDSFSAWATGLTNVPSGKRAKSSSALKRLLVHGPGDSWLKHAALGRGTDPSRAEDGVFGSVSSRDESREEFQVDLGQSGNSGDSGDSGDGLIRISRTACPNMPADARRCPLELLSFVPGLPSYLPRASSGRKNHAKRSPT
ncbi:uncharacterized protein UV8b_04313 [Ustilaginoidea virens]|uniref:Uncharacterized protein n=1 Tax=Ustilaginoidea virens TaxID=1159556 RepID=A0A8E5MHL3_USTVR|nr:uncharacterized protein UV8b_04313 [Ustilaginoidea virens]QUC20072.1 hypothetical protein UV8b_04313 [Ustilaginoidea virens]